MPNISPLKAIIIGVFLMILGVVLPFLMVIKILPTTWFLNLFSYTASLVGMVVAFLGLFTYVRIRRQ